VETRRKWKLRSCSHQVAGDHVVVGTGTVNVQCAPDEEVALSLIADTVTIHSDEVFLPPCGDQDARTERIALRDSNARLKMARIDSDDVALDEVAVAAKDLDALAETGDVEATDGASIPGDGKRARGPGTALAATNEPVHIDREDGIHPIG